MSSHKYDLNQADNPLVHLTNNAIQKHADNYGAFEEGNILSFKEASVSMGKETMCALIVNFGLILLL